MASFDWRRRPTRHSGDQWVAFAELRLLSASGRSRLFSVQIDTGAVVTVLRRSAAQLLGIDPRAGEQIDLVSVGGPPSAYSVHPVRVRIGDLPEFSIRVAIASDENAPNLLGRVDVFDCVSILLDARSRSTTFEAASRGS